MNIKQYISNNPFRVLGVYSTATAKEILANKNRINAYLKVNKTISFEVDKLFSEELRELTRDVDMINRASTQINLQETKWLAALTWFAQSTPIDKILLNHLLEGNVEKSLEIGRRKITACSLINTAVIFLIQNDYNAAIRVYLQLFTNNTYRNEYLRSICGDTFILDQERSIQIWVQSVLDSQDEEYIQCLLAFDKIKQVATHLLIQEPIHSIDSAIANVKEIDSDLAEENLVAGTQLMNITKPSLVKIQRVLAEEEQQYQMIVDRLANQILQCSINYYNATEEDDSISVDKALALATYAQKIAKGSVVKGRIKQNIDVLNAKKKTINVQIEIKYIAEQLEQFQKLSQSVGNAADLVSKCLPYLQKLKISLGVTDDLYIKISDAVANNALGMVISVINGRPNKYVCEQALDVMDKIGTLDLSYIIKNRLLENKSILREIIKNLSSKPTPISPSHPSPNNGCLEEFISDFSGCSSIALVISGLIIVLLSFIFL